MTSNLLSETVIVSVDDLVKRMKSGIKSSQKFRIGVEHESFVFSQPDHLPVPYEGERSILSILNDMNRKLNWESITDKENLIGLSNPTSQAGISLEPGGQIEVSSAPLKNVHQIKEEIFGYITILKDITHRLDLGIVGIGANPKWALAEIPVMPKSRYKLMKKYMPEVGTHGRDMMFRTCTTQVSLDFSSEIDMIKKLRVSLKLQPLATALFAFSPFTERKINGFQSWRGEIWRHTDRNRTGLLPFVFEKNFCFEHYIQWALDIPMYFIIRNDQYYGCTDITFRQFMNGALKGRVELWYPTMEDWENHLSTLFPDVRLRNCLEMRGADSSTPQQILALTAFWTGLLYDSSALQDVEDLTSSWSFHDVENLRNNVPSQGMKATIHNQPLINIAHQVLSFSRNGLKKRSQLNHKQEDETIFLKSLENIINSQKSLSDEIIASYHNQWNNSVEPFFEEYAY
ncbi:MAG: glutamate--cysteine ligase [Candidatus Liberibacter ctenarytainae]|uniref:Glutamate--cysteine ligase n=1 Tax=Candidatus Liberibacter ctenarytainae TaxID=2020335 RepID=A0A937AFZ1_9HYPH|nr:glutamate--cysteine ligase [Candidatus Liberibacter ctenarytainae]